MRLRLQELQETDSEAQELRTKDGYQDIDGVLHHQGLPFIPEAIRMELISRHHNDPLAGHFGIEKTRELLIWKYYQPTLKPNVEAYVKGCDVCFALKAIRHKPYSNLQSLPLPTHWWKNLSMDFIIGLLISNNWKGDSYDSILVIVDRLTKMIHYKPVKLTINAPGLTKVIINIVVRHHGLPNSIVMDKGFLFTLKFWSLLCYFLGIKRRLSTAFYPQTDRQTKRQNSTMEAYLWAFDNFEQNDWASLLLMIEFMYNNAKNASIGYTSFKLNCSYHPCVFFEEDINPCSQSKTAKELSSKLRKLMTVYQENFHHA